MGVVSLICPANAPGQGNTNMETGIVSMSAHEKELILTLNVSSKTRIRILELRSYESQAEKREYPTVWEGNLQGKSVGLPRFDGKRDRLYSKFVVISSDTGELIGFPHYVDDCSALGARDFDFPWTQGIKGISIIIDLDDAVSLGVRYAADNLIIGSLLDLNNPNPRDY